VAGWRRNKNFNKRRELNFEFSLSLPVELTRGEKERKKMKETVEIA
jgi:hypothetical protein